MSSKSTRFLRWSLLMVVGAASLNACGDDASTSGTVDETADAALDASRPDHASGNDVGSKPDTTASLDAAIDTNVDVGEDGLTPTDVTVQVDAPDPQAEGATPEPAPDGAGEAASADAGATDAGDPRADADGGTTATDGPLADGAASDADASPAEAGGDTSSTVPDAGLDAAVDGPSGNLEGGDTCADAVVIASGHFAGQTLLGYTSNYGGLECGARTGQPDRVYAVTVGVGQHLSVTLLPGAPFDATLGLVTPPANCVGNTAFTCSQSVDEGLGGDSEHLEYLNLDAVASETIGIIVGAWQSPGTFALDVKIEAIPPGNTCETAVAIPPGTLADQSTVGSFNAFELPTSTCTGYTQQGPERVYSINVPVGQKLTATAAPGASFDTAIYLIRGPAAQCHLAVPCLVGRDNAGNGALDTVSYTNQSQADETIFVVVDGFFEAGGPFSLTTAVGPP